MKASVGKLNKKKDDWFEEVDKKEEKVGNESVIHKLVQLIGFCCLNFNMQTINLGLNRKENRKTVGNVFGESNSLKQKLKAN